MYQIFSDTIIKRLADSAYIPTDPANRDYMAYREWLTAGNTPQPADPAPVLPDVSGFMEGVKATFGGIIAANALAKAYPLFYSALREGKFDDVQALILDAKASGAITTARYTTLQQLAAQFNLPVTLP